MTTQAESRLAHLRSPALRAALVELLAVLVTLACVWLMGEEHILGWPLGILGAALYVGIFYRARLYSDVLLQVYFLGTSVYGWYYWARGGAGEGAAAITTLSNAERAAALLACAGGVALLGWLMRRYTRAALPYWDAVTTVLSLVAQYLLTIKVVESWALWVTVDVVAIFVYRARGLYATMVLYMLLLALATNGWIEWIGRL